MVFLAVAAAAPAAEAQNRYSRQLLDMTEIQRLAVLTEMLKRSGERCDRAVKVMFMGGRDVDDWSVACRDGNAYLIGIDGGPDGSTKIVDCRVVSLLTKGAGGCWVKY